MGCSGGFSHRGGTVFIAHFLCCSVHCGCGCGCGCGLPVSLGGGESQGEKSNSGYSCRVSFSRIQHIPPPGCAPCGIEFVRVGPPVAKATFFTSSPSDLKLCNGGITMVDKVFGQTYSVSFLVGAQTGRRHTSHITFDGAKLQLPPFSTQHRFPSAVPRARSTVRSKSAPRRREVLSH